MKALGQEEVPDDPRFSTHHARIENKAALREIVNDALKARTGEEWEALLESVDVPAGLIRNIAEVMAEDGQAVARGISQRMTLPGHDREIGVPTVGFKANGEVVAADTPPPELGADTDGVLAEIGYSEGDIAELRDAGVI
jgi:crotonobetainyl-CoA:carnitine CoA-transferase CaiB-like acyl-CoA transferase